MKKIIFIARAALGVGIIIFAVLRLCSFTNFAHLVLGTGILLAGVLFALFMEHLGKPWLFAPAPVYAVLVFALAPMPHFPWHYVQYFSAGFLVYFACSLFGGLKFEAKKTREP